MSDVELIHPEKTEPPVIKCGFPVMHGTFKRIKHFSSILTLLLIIDILLSLRLFISSIKIRNHLGYFINLIATGEGDVLPSLQAIPVLFFLLINVAMFFFIFKSFDKTEKPTLNQLMFLMVVLGFLMIIILFALIIAVISHAYGAHESLHNGIIKAMSNYSTNVQYKAQIDHLQVEFQCCGSKKYDEWYEIKWYDPSLEGSGCCSMKSLFPCIHHDIEVTGKVYLYTPEENLSISTRGCYEMIRERKQSVGWGIVGNLFLYLALQCLTVAFFRLIQTAHFEKSRFFGNRIEYTMWVFGCYSGDKKKKKKTKSKTKTKKKKKPKVPPLPDELKR